MVNPNPTSFRAPNEIATVAVSPLGVFQLVAGVPQDVNTMVIPSLRGLTGDIQSIWMDATRAPQGVTLLNDLTRQYAYWPRGTFGWQSLLVTAPLKMKIRSDASAEVFICTASALMPFGLERGDIVQSSELSRRVDVAASVASQTFLPVQAQRQGFSLFNDSTAMLYLNLDDSAASLVNFSVEIGPRGYFESPYNYGGEVRGVWTAAVGGARITEFL